MKTKEYLNQKYAHGPVNLYDIYLEGYQDCKKDNEDSFRREAAKDILCALAGNKDYLKVIGRIEPETMLAIRFADELIRQLKEEPK